MFVLRPGVSIAQAQRLHVEWTRCANARRHATDVVGALTFLAFASLVGGSLLLLGAAMVVAVLAAAAVGSVMASLARKEVRGSWKWPLDAEVALPLAVVDRLRAARVVGQADPEMLHRLLWHTSRARQTLRAAQDAVRHPDTGGDAEVIALLEAERDEAAAHVAQLEARFGVPVLTR